MNPDALVLVGWELGCEGLEFCVIPDDKAINVGWINGAIGSKLDIEVIELCRLQVP